MLCASSHRSFFASHKARNSGERSAGAALSAAALFFSSTAVILCSVFAVQSSDPFPPCLFAGGARGRIGEMQGCGDRIDHATRSRRHRAQRSANESTTRWQNGHGSKKENARFHG